MNTSIQRASELVQQRIINRDDVHAMQLPDGSYVRRASPITPELVLRHLRGDITLGTYLLDIQDRVKVIIVDLDRRDRNPIGGLKAAFQSLAAEILKRANRIGLLGALEDSGSRGIHVWFLFETGIPASRARAAARFLDGLGSAHPLISLEIFPKQDTRGPGGYGNLIKLPWGINRKSGNRSVFVDSNLDTAGTWPDGQVQFLKSAAINDARLLDQYGAPPSSPATSGVGLPAPSTGGDQREAWRRTLRVLENPGVRPLYSGDQKVVERYRSKSEAEFALILKLLLRKVPPSHVYEVMFASRIGKWEESEHYRQITLNNATRRAEQLRRQNNVVSPASGYRVPRDGDKSNGQI
jgi:hypothetical protein